MKRIVFVMIALLIGIGVATAQNAKKAVIFSDNVEHDFGTIKEADGSVTHTFVIKNTGDAPLVITRVVASCGCTTPQFSKEPIAPGQTSKIDVAYNPAGRPGQFVKTIAVYSNGKDGTFTLRIKGVVE